MKLKYFFKLYIVFFLIATPALSQDEIVFRKSCKVTDYELKIERITTDSIHIKAFGQIRKLQIAEIIAYRYNYKNNPTYHYPDRQDSINYIIIKNEAMLRPEWTATIREQELKVEQKLKRDYQRKIEDLNSDLEELNRTIIRNKQKEKRREEIDKVVTKFNLRDTSNHTFEIGLGYPRFPIFILYDPLRITEKVPSVYMKLKTGKYLMRSGLTIYPNKNHVAFRANLGIERRITIDKFQVLGGIDYGNSTGKLYPNTLYSFNGAGPVIGLAFNPTRYFSIQTETGFLYGIQRLSSIRKSYEYNVHFARSVQCYFRF